MKVKYKEQEINIPEGATIEVVSGDLVILDKKQEFKNGDVLCHLDGSFPFIFRCFNAIDKPKYYFGYSFGRITYSIIDSERYWTNSSVRLATKEESKPLFDALAEDGKRWDPETKQIEDIPKVGDICIFWDDDKAYSFIATLIKISDSSYSYRTSMQTYFKNAIKCNSLEQYKNFLK